MSDVTADVKGATPARAPSKWRSRAFLVARVVVTVALLYVLLQRVDFALVVDRLAGVRPSFLVIGAALIATQSIVVMATRWGLVLEALGTPQPWRRLARIMTVSLFFNETLPSTVGGDAVRAMLLRRHGMPLGAAVQSIAVERVMGLLSLLFFALFGAVSLLAGANDRLPLFVVILVTAGSLTGAGLVILLARLRITLPDFLGLARRPYDAVMASVLALGGNRRRLALMIGLSLTGQLLVFSTLWMATLAVQVPISPWYVFAVMPSVILVTIVPISVGGWGVREGAMVLGLGLVGVAAADAITISLLFGFKFALFGALAGVVWLFTRSPR